MQVQLLLLYAVTKPNNIRGELLADPWWRGEDLGRVLRNLLSSD